ncbi:GNAT family N-acetyltransferase [Candidatus Bathyarchaeota archaeon]|nr:GNAT family N-acetyltransferase [Candidatus Bathyarchaeota archaeon]
MKIRDAVADDLDALIALNEEVHSIHVSLFPDVFRNTDASALGNWFKGQMSNAATAVLLGIEDDRVVAYLIMRMVKRDADVFCHARSCVYIDHLCVAAEYRNRGVARALIEETKRRAKQEGMTRLELDVWSENREAKRAFHALGFTTYNEQMAREI